ncbi:hypothetical protein E4555_19275 [Escherichia coli]|nr:hypothetical protein [Escherichia coli]
MRHECLIRPASGARICRPDKRSASGIGHHSRMRRDELNPKTWTVSVNRLFDTQSGILPG